MSRRTASRAQSSPFMIALATAPFTDQTKVIFRYDQLTGDYITIDFNPMQTLGHVTQEDIEKVFSTLKKLPNYRTNTTFLALINILMILLPLAAYGLFLYFFITKITYSGSITVILVSVLVATALLMILIFGFSFGYGYYLRYKIRKRTEEINQCLQDFNQKEFSAKQVFWKVGTLGAWIQLDLNYVFAQMNNMAAVLPPMQPFMQPGMQMMTMNYQMPIPMQTISIDQKTMGQDQNINSLEQSQVYNPANIKDNFRPTKM